MLSNIRSESNITGHRLDVNPEAAHFMMTDSGATEVEYLSLIESLIGVFKPTYLVETGTWHGDGAAALLRAACPGSTVISLCHHALDEPVREGLEAVARERESEIRIVQANTIDLIDGRCGFSWADLTFGKATFAFPVLGKERLHFRQRQLVHQLRIMRSL